MSEQATIAELFDLAIATERACETLYRELAARFVDHLEVADFWERYAGQEAGHAQWLQRVRDMTSPAQLAAPADPVMLQNARALAQFSVTNALQGIHNLDDAYQLANELENSEVNAIFEFLVTHFAPDEEVREFLRAQLHDHLARLAGAFPTQYKGVIVRRAIAALTNSPRAGQE